VRDIVLLPIGGMARAERIPENPWQEIVVAVSGPIVNFVLAAVFFLLLWFTGGAFGFGESFFSDLLAINLVLGTFNLIPAFPMDGGRVLRALLAVRFPYLKATRYARAVGQVIALLFVVVGFLNSAFLMLPVIAVFIFFGAMSEENLIRARLTLDNRSVRDFVHPGPAYRMDEPVASAAGAAGRDPVVLVVDEAGTAAGVVPSVDLMMAAAEGRGDMPMSALVRRDFPVLRADMPATQAYYFLKAERRPYAGVVDEGAFIGLLYFERLENAPERPPDSA
jgi:stage IV sporulation protein FB